MIQKQENWVLYELKPRDVERRFCTCKQLIQRHQRKGFLHWIVFCIGLEMRSGYSTATSRRKNTMLSPVNRCHRPQHQHHGHIIRRSCSVSVWWDQKGLVYYELLKPGDSITGDRYRLQLIRLSRAKRARKTAEIRAKT